MCHRDSTAQRPGQALEVADIFRAYGDAYRATHPLDGATAPGNARPRAVPDPALGGHLLQCDHCGAYEARYHSCRNRHWPKCQAVGQGAVGRSAPGRPPAHPLLPLCIYPASHA